MDVKELTHIYNKIRKITKKYEKNFVKKFDLNSKYDLWTNKEVTVAGKVRKELYFIGIIIQSSYVGFYYMPMYVDTSIKKKLGKELLSTQKGKSCFHIKKLDKNMEKQIDHALKLGVNQYKKKKWI